jgi:glucose/mannose transport system permease protein
MMNEAVSLPSCGAAELSTKSRRRKHLMGRILIYSMLIILALFFLSPLIIMIITSLKTTDEIRSGNILSLPHAPTLDAWFRVWSSACIGVQCDGLKGHFLITFLMVVPAVCLSVSLGALNGYVLTKWPFKGHKVVFALMLFGCFIPFQIVLIPMARLLGIIGLAGTIPGLVFVHVVYGIGFTTLFFRNYFVSIPSELIKAARVDGADFWAILLRILLPVSWPVIMVAVIWQFTGIWNDFLFGVAFSAGSSQPVTVALNNLVNTATGTKAYNDDMAAAIIAAMPTIAVYIVSGRYFVRGLMAGSVKG